MRFSGRKRRQNTILAVFLNSRLGLGELCYPCRDVPPVLGSFFSPKEADKAIGEGHWIPSTIDFDSRFAKRRRVGNESNFCVLLRRVSFESLSLALLIQRTQMKKQFQDSMEILFCLSQRSHYVSSECRETLVSSEFRHLVWFGKPRLSRHKAYFLAIE